MASKLRPWLAAACFALGAGWLAALYSLSRTEYSLARTQENLAALALKSAGNQLEAGIMPHPAVK